MYVLKLTEFDFPDLLLKIEKQNQDGNLSKLVMILKNLKMNQIENKKNL